MSVEIRLLETSNGICKQKMYFDEFDHTTLQGFFDRHNVPVNYMCGGAGICGKCKIKFLQGAPKWTEEEEDYFTQEELENGFRLACMCDISGGHLTEKEFSEKNENKYTKFSDDIIIELVPYPGYFDSVEFKSYPSKVDDDNYEIAIDLGTTSVGVALLDNDGNIRKHFTYMNPNVRYGADVMSRMNTYNQQRSQNKDDMTLQLQNFLMEQSGEASIVVSGNTVMSHILLGLDCAKLAVAPFEPVTLDYINYSEDMYIVPGASAFIGGDIISGLYSLDANAWNDTTLFIDLGTNGEIVLFNDGKYYSTSASAGPAMEGVNISCGMPCIAGAIYEVMIAGERSSVKTISNAKAAGICGSGLVSAIYGLRKNNILDENGVFIDKYRNDGYIFSNEIRLTQDDVREFLLAKAAIATAWQMLLTKAKVEINDIKKVLISGSFGSNIDINKAKKIGLIPEASDVKAMGNTSLQGAVKVSNRIKEVGKEKVNDELLKLALKIENIVLPEDEHFQECFLKNIRL